MLHYIANVVKEKYTQVSLFYNELHYVEKAAAGELLTVNRNGSSYIRERSNPLFAMYHPKFNIIYYGWKHLLLIIL